MSNRITGDMYVDGTLRAKEMVLADNTVTNAKVAGDAAIAESKLKHLHHRQFAQPNTAAAAVTQVVHEARAAGSLLAVRAGSIAAAIGDSTVTVDLRKNGSTVLSGTIQLDSSNTAYISEAGGVAGAAYVAGDVFTVVITVSAGTGTLPTGVFVTALFGEAFPA